MRKKVNDEFKDKTKQTRKKDDKLKIRKRVKTEVLEKKKTKGELVPSRTPVEAVNSVKTFKATKPDTKQTRKKDDKLKPRKRVKTEVLEKEKTEGELVPSRTPVEAVNSVKTFKATKPDDVDAKLKRDCGFDLGESRTLFVRNLPYDVQLADLKTVIESSGFSTDSIYLVKDAAGVCRGSAFAKFKSSEDLDSFLKLRISQIGAAQQSTSITTGSSFDEFYKTSDGKAKKLLSIESSLSSSESSSSSDLFVNGRKLFFAKALAKESLPTPSTLNNKLKNDASLAPSGYSTQVLLREGYIDPKSDEFKSLSPSEQKQREASWKERNFRLFKNTNFVLNPLRLSLRNLPKKIDKKSIILACPVQVKNCTLIEERDGKRGGFAFVDFKSTDDATKTLRKLNNNPRAFGNERGPKPIVEFTLEDKRKLKILEAAKQRQRKWSLDKKEKKNDQETIKKTKKLSRGRKQREQRRLKKTDKPTEN